MRREKRRLWDEIGNSWTGKVTKMLFILARIAGSLFKQQDVTNPQEAGNQRSEEPVRQKDVVFTEPINVPIINRYENHAN
jgi:hypothetical protein